MAAYIGRSVVDKHVEQAKKEILEPAEQLEGIFHCGIVNIHGERGLSLHDYLIVTNKRVIAWGRGLLSKSIQSFNYNKITSVEAHKGLLMGELLFNVYGAREVFHSMVNTDVLTAKKMIEDHISNIDENTESKLESVEDKIEKLGKLLEKRLITRKEFETRKRKLLVEA